MNGIGWAVKELQHGSKVRRAGWNGKGQWLALMVPDDLAVMTAPYVYIHNAQGLNVPWNASQGDLLALDWEIT